jgi:hypothetical protein
MKAGECKHCGFVVIRPWEFAQAREKSGYSIRQLADQCGWSGSFQYKLETEGGKIPESKLPILKFLLQSDDFVVRM